MKIFIALLFIISLISCEKEDNDFGNINSPSDWQFNDNFNQSEKSLFDSLDFNKTAVYEEKEEAGYITNTPEIIFAPNPFTDVPHLFYNTAPIINIVIINNAYKKILDARFENSHEIAFNLSDKPSGIYRLYYVIQDSTYNIVQLGHGNIQKK